MKKILYPLRRLAYWMAAGIDQILDRENPAVILAFHSIDNSQWFFGNSQAQLEVYLREISKHYKFISLAEMLEVVKKKKHYLEKVIAITFDDGYRSLMTVAPLFQEYGIRPTVFALSDPEHVNRQQIENQHDLLTDSELNILHKTFGWEVGCHSATHEDLSSLDPKRLSQQILDAKKKLSKTINNSVNYFAYPKGRYTDKVIAHVQKAGYEAAFTMDHLEIKLLGDPHRIPRVGINRTHTPSEVVNSLSPSVLVFKNFLYQIFNKNIYA